MSTQKLTAKDLEKKLKSAADVLRKSLNASENYKLVLPLLFVKRLNDNFINKAEYLIKEKKLSKEEAYENPRRHTFFVPEKAFYKKLQETSSEVGKKINKIFKLIEEANEDLEGTLVNAEFAKTDKYSDEVLRKIISIFAEENLADSNLANEDVFGDAYEFLLEEYASETKKKGGQFYTPRQVVRLMVNIVKPKPGMRICDPTCGSGGMLIQSRKYIEKHFPKNDPTNLTLEGQESNPDTVNLGKMNMVIHGITDFKIEPGDVLEKPKLLDDGKLRTYDRVLANFPFSENWDKSNKENDSYERFVFGIPPSKKRADFAFIQHMIAILDKKGMAAIVASQGVLFRERVEKTIREKLVNEDIIEVVIALPEKIFYGTPISGCIIIVNKSKPISRKEKILFIHAGCDFEELPNRNILREDDMNKITDAVKKFENIEKYCHVAEKDEIKANDYTFSVARYVDTLNKEKDVDIHKTITKIESLQNDINNLKSELIPHLNKLEVKRLETK